MYGGMQIILATDLEGRIKELYYQKLSSPESKKFRDRTFLDKFKGLTLADFYSGELPEITDPSENSEEDFLNTIRGIRKNLILLDEFKLNNMHDAYWGGKDDE